MPWCPQCGAEYREAVETCANCHVPLQDQPPPRSGDTADAARGVRVGPIDALREQVAAAVAHAAAGWKALWRHRALLLVPLLLGLLHTSQAAMMHYARVRPAAGQVQRLAGDDGARLDVVASGLWPLLRDRLLRSGPLLATPEFAAPVPWFNFQATATVIDIEAYRGTRPDDESPRSVLPNWPLRIAFYLLGLAVSGLILGGFYGTASRAVERDAFTWSDFGRDGRRYWLRFFLFGVIVTALALWPRPVTSAWYGPGPDFRPVPGLAIVGFFLALTWCAIVTQDVGLWRALQRSVVTVGRCAATGLCLLLLLTLARFLLLLPVEVGDTVLMLAYDSYRFTPLLYLPAIILRSTLLAVLSVWFSLTALHWYGGARVKIAARQAVGVN